MRQCPTTVRRFITLCVVLAVVLGGSAALADTYQVDSIHSYILFRVKHLGIGYTYGQFIGVTGNFTFDTKMATENAIEMQVSTKNIYTGDTKRDNHLRSPDFFDIEKHPYIYFKGKLVKETAKDTYLMTGELTILGVSRPVRAKVLQTGKGKDPQGKYRRGFETTPLQNPSQKAS